MSGRISSKQRVLAYATGSFGMAVNAMIQFLLPLRAVELGVSIGVIGLLLGTKALLESVVSVPVGGLIDRVGPRQAFLLGTAASIVIGLGFMLATNVLALFLLQVVLGIARPLAWVGGQSYVAGLREGAERTYDTGRFSFAANIGQIGAPLAVGFIAQAVSVQVSFGFFAGYAGLFLLLGFLLPDVSRNAPGGGKSKSFREAVTLLRIPGIRVAMLLTFARLFIPATWISFFPLFLVTSGIGEGVAGSVVSAMALTATFLSLLAGRLGKLGSAEMVTAAGLACSAVGVAASPLLATPVLAFVAALLVGVGQGISLPMLIVIVSDAAPDDQRGLALGLRASVNQVSSTMAPVVIGPILGAVGVMVGFPIAGAIIGLALAGATALHLGGARRDSDSSAVDAEGR